MAFIGFGGNVKNKKFDYIPQHYDPELERIEKTYAKYNTGNLSDAEAVKMRIQSGLRSKARGNKEVKKKMVRAANLRLILIVVLLIILCYYVLQSNGFEKMINSLLT
ncbi:MAG: hypothetical protein V3V00_15530 [Saprospiraceae bacterium]